MVNAESEQIDSISSYKARQLPTIPQPDVRTVVHKILDCTATHTPYDLPDTTKLQMLYPSLWAILNLYVRDGVQSPHYRAYRSLFQQISAPDIVLQLVPYDAIAPLQTIARLETPPDWLQYLSPALGCVVNSYRDHGTAIPIEFSHLAGWLADRAIDVYTRLAQHDPAAVEMEMLTGDWRETGTCYGLSAIRRRRVYSKLRYDARPLERDAEEMGDCNKFYKTYSKNNLTGGILVLWCTHSICLGFHSIPIAEGRNDVFAAIYTHFPVAPEVIIYDFACQLAPYCLVREARYFRHTRFLIDEMYAHDHTRCGQACFASNVMRFDDRIRAVNTSAAECGNKGMKRIRKSVSFMVYEHAVIFTKVFLDVWNRNIINRMGKVATERPRQVL